MRGAMVSRGRVDVRLHFQETPWDLRLAVGYTLVMTAVLLALGGNLLAILLVLFVPGYVLVAALFPRNGDIDWIERVALAFGLSIAVVPLLGLLLNFTPFGIRPVPVFATIANEGRWIQPSLVRGTVDQQGEFHPAAAPVVRRVVSAESAEMVSRMLAYAVEYGTGTRARVKGFQVAGGSPRRIVSGTSRVSTSRRSSATCRRGTRRSSSSRSSTAPPRSTAGWLPPRCSSGWRASRSPPSA